jgi:hypothetical protein
MIHSLLVGDVASCAPVNCSVDSMILDFDVALILFENK